MAIPMKHKCGNAALNCEIIIPCARNKSGMTSTIFNILKRVCRVE